MDKDLDSFNDSSTIVIMGGDSLMVGGLSNMEGNQESQDFDGASCE